MAKGHVECNIGYEVLHQKVYELWHLMYWPQYPNYEV